jgi:hypothetical protein
MMDCSAAAYLDWGMNDSSTGAQAVRRYDESWGMSRGMPHDWGARIEA